MAVGMRTPYRRQQIAAKEIAASTVDAPNIASTVNAPGEQAPSWDVAASRKAASLGISLPAGFKDAVINYAKVKGPQTGVFDYANPFINDAAARVQDYANNPTGFYETALYGAGGYNAKVATYGQNNPVDAKASIEQIQSIAQGAVNLGIPVNNVQSQLMTGANDTITKFNKDSSGGDSLFDVAFNVGAPIAMAFATGGLSLPQQIAFNATTALMQGAKPEDVVRSVIATVAADKLPGQLNEINKAISNYAPEAVQATVKSALVNAERQAVAAAITKQDIAKFALAGAAGGAVGDLAGVALAKASPTMKSELIQALSRASAEYAQYKAAGFTDEQALQKSISGYIAEEQKIESAAAKSKQQTAGLSAEQVGVAQTYGQTAGFTSNQAGQYTGLDAGGKRLAPVDVTGTADQSDVTKTSLASTASPGARRTSATDARSLPPVTVYGKYEPEPEVAEDISIAATQTPAEEEAPPKEQTPEKLRQDMILTSLINKNVNRPLYSNKAKTVTQQAGTPGTAALSQALRVGDVGAPIFGRDEEGRRAGWNLQSLRYMGDVGAEK